MKWNLDKIGMAASGICAVHCMLVPFVLVVFPFLAVAISASEKFEWAFLGISAIIAAFAMFQGYVYHKKPIPYILASVGFFVFIGAKLVLEHSHGHGHDHHGEEMFFSALIHVGAGLLIILAHYLNHKLIKHTKCSCTHEH